MSIEFIDFIEEQDRQLEEELFRQLRAEEYKAKFQELAFRELQREEYRRKLEDAEQKLSKGTKAGIQGNEGDEEAGLLSLEDSR